MQHKTNNIIDTIRNNVRISQFVTQYVPLSQKGANFLGICPFHAEKTPSFTVNDDKKLFHCFGCKESGDIFQFTIKYLHLDFKSALKHLAEYAGIPLDSSAYKKISAREALGKNIKELNNQVALVYHNTLKTPSENIGKEVYEYLGKRGINKPSISEFLIGASPKDYSYLSKKIDMNLYPPLTISTSQLFYQEPTQEAKDNNDLKDKFRNKIIFPIQDIAGDVIAFGSRVLDQSLPKYINSAETPLFIKKETLYGLFQAKESIKESKFVYITEGYFDVIAMHQYGYKNTVATLGTALSKLHIQSLKKLADQITLVFDGDIAGEKAAIKALFLCLEEEITPKLILCETNKDPFDMVMSYKEYTHQWISENGKNWEEFLLYTIQKESNPMEQQKLLNQYSQKLDKINPFIKKFFSQSVKNYLNTFSKNTYNSSYRSSHINSSHKEPQKRLLPSLEEKEKYNEELFICLCIDSQEHFYQLQKDLHISSSFFINRDVKELFSLFLDSFSLPVEKWISDIPTPLQKIWHQHYKSIHAIEDKKKAILDCYYSIQIVSLKQQEHHLKQEMKNTKEEEPLLLILKELELLNKKKKLFELKIKNDL